MFFAVEDGETHIVSKNKTCHSDQKYLIAKFRLKLKKIGKATRPSRYDLNQIPYDYTVEVTNRFKRLDLLHTVSGDPWMEVYSTV